jgi:hypothetical protein
MNVIGVKTGIPTQKRSMRRPYKSMTHANLVSKRTVLQAKLEVLQNRLATWNEKIAKYEFELNTRTENTEQDEEAASESTTME